MINYGYTRVTLPHDIEALCLLDIPWVEALATLPYSSQIFTDKEFDRLVDVRQKQIEEAFTNKQFEGMSLDTENEIPVSEQMVAANKTVAEWEEYFTRIGIEVNI